MNIKQFCIALLFSQLWLSTGCAKNNDSLRGAQNVIAELNDSLGSGPSKQQSKAKTLLDAIEAYRLRQNDLSNKQSAQQWFELAERSQNISQQDQFNAIDPVTGKFVGIHSLIASLPAPSVWPELNKHKHMDSELDLDQASLNFIFASLVNDQASKMKIIDTMQNLIENSDSSNQYKRKGIFDKLHKTVIRQSGDVNKILSLLENQIASQEEYSGSTKLPDLVTLLGKDKAEQWLRKQLIQSRSDFNVSQGDQTQKLAQDLALELVDKLLVPHWGLVKGLHSTEFYEALVARFGKADSSWARQQAELYYLLGLIAAGENNKASEFAITVAAEHKHLYLPSEGLDELEKLGYTQELYSFFKTLLSQTSAFSFWDDYIKLSALTGNTKSLISQIENKLSTADISSKRKLWFREKLVMALLASDQTKRAGKVLIDLIAESNNEKKGVLALKLVLIGELLNNEDWMASGLKISKQVWDAQLQKKPTGQNNTFYSDYIKTLRRLDQTSEAEQVIIQQIIQYSSLMKSYSAAMGMQLNSQLSIMLRPLAIQLIGVYADAGRWDDVIYLAEHFPFWGESDLSEFFTSSDSNKVPIGLTIAEALINTDKTELALPILEAIIKQKGGLDRAYELYAQIQGADAISFFDQRYQQDQFEERPLIWKASLLLQADQLKLAKATVQQAIQIDPSDGEQGTGDRMRAYTIMADILAAEGDNKGADFNRRAVRAIRLSEQADRFTKAGMFDRAIKMYSEASNQFADAYCIQSRLALQLTKQGQFKAAAVHYQKAFELMPASFGRVESHCFGCENVFQHPTAQGIAQQVFDKLLAQQPLKPQVHYMIGYLKKEQGKYLEAIPYFRKAVALDPQYLNAWKQFYELGEHVYIEAWERDIAALKMLQLDPQRRHAKINLGEVSDLKGLWTHGEKLVKINKDKPTQLFALIESAKRLQDEQQKSTSSMTQALSVFGHGQVQLKVNTPGSFLTQSKLVGSALQLMSNK